MRSARKISQKQLFRKPISMSMVVHSIEDAGLRNHRVNDSWVVPHHQGLLMKFNCHINVEICTSIASVKYIFKYINKGNDCAHVEIRENTLNHDEIMQYLNARY